MATGGQLFFVFQSLFWRWWWSLPGPPHGRHAPPLSRSIRHGVVLANAVHILATPLAFQLLAWVIEAWAPASAVLRGTGLGGLGFGRAPFSYCFSCLLGATVTVYNTWSLLQAWAAWTWAELRFYSF
jgi:hypothetical protein